MKARSKWIRQVRCDVYMCLSVCAYHRVSAIKSPLAKFTYFYESEGTKCRMST